MREEIEKIWKVINKHESRLRNMNWDNIFKKFFKRKQQYERQKDYYTSLHLALCVDTRDPWKQNRIRFFSPVLDLSSLGNDSDGRATKLEQCAWAWPISAMGGIDDSGLNWVPPPGSTVAILFQNANPKTAFYLGTIWQRDKGPEGSPNWGIDIPEYDKIFRGHRKGYMCGKNDESQSFPPHNTTNYQGLDFDSTADSDLVTQAATKTTWPHIYSWKSPEKHAFVLDDGDPKCNRRGKRLEIMSSMGNYFLMKDDPYNHCGFWVNPQCRTSFTDIIPEVCVISYTPYSNINFPSISQIAQPYACAQGPEYCSLVPSETSGRPVEEEYLGRENFCPYPDPMSSISVSISNTPVDCLGVLKGLTDFCFSFNNEGKNRYHKQKQECYPFLEGRCGLPQSGIQLLSRGQNAFVMDDSVEEPRERPEWERTLKPFDRDGCTGVYKGRMWLREATGHFIELNGEEVSPKTRGPKNGVTIGTACGQFISLNDHTTLDGFAGPNRGVRIKSSADHEITLCDEGNKQSSPVRDGCAKTGPHATKAYMQLRTGYGIKIMMNDGRNQGKTDQQYFQILSPQKDNLQRGPHMLHMQEKASGPGQIFLRSGGDYIVYSYDDMVEVVGEVKDNPSNKLEFVSNMKIVNVKDVYYNKSKSHVFWADDNIFLLSGQDQGENSPTIMPVVVAHSPIPEYIQLSTGLKASEYVFASARPLNITCASD